ncbi:Serine/threonine-protein phosphatase 2A activator [Chytriomyces hyalinus]|nr:Serine/threonine-protein phosphatase 2A activator [Chytriomyces hyalinus]
MNLNRAVRDASFAMPRMPGSGVPGAPGLPGATTEQVGTPAADVIVPLEVVPQNHVFVAPQKRIANDEGMRMWLKSTALARFVTFIKTINTVYTDKPLSTNCTVSHSVQALLQSLETMNSWVDMFPPMVDPQRFGNRAFKSWVDKLEECANDMLTPLIPTHFQGPDGALLELNPYLISSFGHKTRLDYGSGHELSFIAFLCCLQLVGAVTPDDHPALAFKVIPAYFELVRRLQRVYTLEPAGSHGVWGLDDHQFLCYYWGAAQLVGHKRIKPKSVLQREVVDFFAAEFMYLRAIQFIYETKSGPFHEHSPLLYDISGVPNWAKVNAGMFKMYMAEVVKKLPVVQHIPFGTLLPFEEIAAYQWEIPGTWLNLLVLCLFIPAYVVGSMLSASIAYSMVVERVLGSRLERIVLGMLWIYAYWGVSELVIFALDLSSPSNLLRSLHAANIQVCMGLTGLFNLFLAMERFFLIRRIADRVSTKYYVLFLAIFFIAIVPSVWAVFTSPLHLNIIATGAVQARVQSLSVLLLVVDIIGVIVFYTSTYILSLKLIREITSNLSPEKERARIMAERRVLFSCIVMSGSFIAFSIPVVINVAFPSDAAWAISGTIVLDNVIAPALILYFMPMIREAWMNRVVRALVMGACWWGRRKQQADEDKDDEYEGRYTAGSEDSTSVELVAPQVPFTVIRVTQGG